MSQSLNDTIRYRVHAVSGRQPFSPDPGTVVWPPAGVESDCMVRASGHYSHSCAVPLSWRSVRGRCGFGCGDGGNSLETPRALISAGTRTLVARASCCRAPACCILPSTHPPSSTGHSTAPRHGAELQKAARERPPPTRPFDFIDSRFPSVRTRCSARHFCAASCDAMREQQVASGPFIYLQTAAGQPRVRYYCTKKA